HGSRSLFLPVGARHPGVGVLHAPLGMAKHLCYCSPDPTLPPPPPQPAPPASGAPPGAPPPRRPLDALLPEPRLCLSRLGGLGQSPHQWPSQWRSLAGAPFCRLLSLFSRDPGHALSWEAHLGRAHRARDRVLG